MPDQPAPAQVTSAQLEKCHRPVHEDGIVRLTPQKLQWLLDGYDVWKMKPFEELRFSRVSWSSSDST